MYLVGIWRWCRLRTKNEASVASAIIEGFNKMGGRPKILFTDDERSVSKRSN